PIPPPSARRRNHCGRFGVSCCSTNGGTQCEGGQADRKLHRGTGQCDAPPPIAKDGLLSTRLSPAFSQHTSASLRCWTGLRRNRGCEGRRGAHPCPPPCPGYEGQILRCTERRDCPRDSG